MSQEKAQLIAPQGHFTVPGLNVAGVVTASSFSGNCTGTASSIAQGTNVVVGVMTASSFVGDVTGNVTGIGSNTDNLDVGIVTATSFAGNFTGIGSGLTGTPNVVAGVVTATKFVGNTPGTVSKLADGTNINVGVVTATKFVGNTSGLAAGIAAAQNINVGVLTATGGLYGDGSGLTGAGSTAFIRQTVTASSSGTINLNLGNIVYLTHDANVTIAFSNVPTATDVTIIRTVSSNTITWPAAITWNGGSAPTLISDTANVFQISAQVFNLTTADGGSTWYGYEEISGAQSNYALYGWGFNNYGQLGHNSLTVYSSPVQIGSDSTWSSIVSQAYTVGGVKSDGTLWTWGSNTYGQLGQNNNGNGGATNSQSSPVQVPGTTWTAFGWSGMSHQKAQNFTKTDGTLWVWGSASTGGLGINALSSRSSPTQIPGTTWKVGGSFQFYHGGGAIRTDGTLWVWGSNSQGNLGQNDTTNRSSPIQIPGTTWKQATGNSSGLAAIKTDGTLWKWGHGNQGTGVNNRTQYSSPTQIPGTTWSEVTACQSHYLATKTDGTLWTWGMNSNGQLGQNEVQPGDGGYSSPVQIPGNTWRTTGLSGGAANGRSGAIKTDGTMWAWGDNGQGQLGQNSTTNYSSPIQVGSDTDWKYMRFTSQGMIATKGS